MSDQQLMTIEEVAKYLEIKAVTVKRYAREGLLDSSGGNEPLLFEKSKVERFKDIQSRLR